MEHNQHDWIAAWSTPMQWTETIAYRPGNTSEWTHTNGLRCYISNDGPPEHVILSIHSPIPNIHPHLDNYIKVPIATLQEGMHLRAYLSKSIHADYPDLFDEAIPEHPRRVHEDTLLRYHYRHHAAYELFHHVACFINPIIHAAYTAWMLTLIHTIQSDNRMHAMDTHLVSNFIMFHITGTTIHVDKDPNTGVDLRNHPLMHPIFTPWRHIFFHVWKQYQYVHRYRQRTAKNITTIIDVERTQAEHMEYSMARNHDTPDTITPYELPLFTDDHHISAHTAIHHHRTLDDIIAAAMSTPEHPLSRRPRPLCGYYPPGALQRP